MAAEQMPAKLARLEQELAGLRARLETLEAEREAAAQQAPADGAALAALDKRLAAVEELGARIVGVYEQNKGKPLARLLGLK